MSATLTISVSDAVLARLRERAAEEGTTPEAVLAADAERAIPLKPGELLRKFCGSISFGEANVADRVDELIGDGLVEELRGQPRA